MPTTNPFRTANGMIATHTSGSKVVLLDPASYPTYSNYLNSSFYWNGTNWTNLSPTAIDPNAPLPVRENAIFAYDGTDLILYGGQGGSSASGVLQDTWKFVNGSNSWVQLTPTTVPFGRYNAEATYLSANTTLVMFGGMNANALLEETWVWTHASGNWVQKTPTISPGARYGHMMAASSSSVLVFGGKGTNQLFNDSWLWDGTNWTQKFPTTSPSARSDAGIAFDTVNGVYVMFGGRNDFSILPPETWTYNSGTNVWTLANNGLSGTGPVGRIGASLSYDPNLSKVIMTGGQDNSTVYQETWSWNGSSWTQL